MCVLNVLMATIFLIAFKEDETSGIILLIGWFLFVKKIRVSYLNFHRNIGKIYVVSVLLATIAGIYLGFYATGG